MIYSHFPPGMSRSEISDIIEPLAENITWEDGTDEEVRQMVEWANAGFIDLADYWSVGDERQVTIAQHTQKGVTHVEQTVTFVLMNQGGYNLVQPLTDKNGDTRTEVNFVCSMKHSLLEKTSTVNHSESIRGQHITFQGTPNYTYTNTTFYNALPNYMKSIFCEFVVPGCYYDTNTATTYNAKLLYPAVKEIYGRSASNLSNEEALLPQWSYYSVDSPVKGNKILGGNNADKVETGDGYGTRSVNYGGGYNTTVNVWGDGKNILGGLSYQGSSGITVFGCI